MPMRNCCTTLAYSFHNQAAINKNENRLGIGSLRPLWTSAFCIVTKSFHGNDTTTPTPCLGPKSSVKSATTFGASYM